MTLLVPRAIIEWLDTRRGTMSRQAYIINCLRKLKEIEEM
jgi:hypothetical protein